MKTNLLRWIILGVMAAAIASFFIFDLGRYLSLGELKSQQAALADWVAGNFTQAIVGFALAYVAVTALSLPGAAVMTLAAGALFGVVAGTILVSFASSIGATLAFLASRLLFRDAVRKKFGKRLAALERGVEEEGGFYLFTLRLVPVFPFFLVNLAMGLTPIRTATFYGVSQLGMLPGTIAFVFAGTQLAQIDSLSGILSPGLIGALVVLGLMPLVMKKIAGWLKARRIYAGYQKPKSFDYNMVVIGAGSGGLVSAYIAAALKAKVALIERHKMGGDCLNTGCVPSKALIRSARFLADAKRSKALGIAKVDVEFDFAEVMARVHRVIGQVEPHDSVERYSSLGVECISGDAKIVSPWEVEVGGKRLCARSLVIATGGRPTVPAFAGLDQVDYSTSDTIWQRTTLPKRLLVLGNGPIGCELAQCFVRFGSAVTVVGRGKQLLPREDRDVAEEVAQAFAIEGIDVRLEHDALRFERRDGEQLLIAKAPEGEVSIAFDHVLIALGRTANVTGFGLEALGVVVRKNGTIDADPLMRTNFPNIAVAGDVTGPYQFTHVASHQAWYASVNQLISPWWSFNVDYRVIPWATFTDPQVARVGLSEREATEQGIAVEVSRYGIDDLDRAIADEAAHGFIKVLTEPGKDKILGVTIVAAEAGELIAEYVLAMKHGLGMNKILGTIHAYPTWMETNKYVAGVWKRAHAPQGILQMAQNHFRRQRG